MSGEAVVEALVAGQLREAIARGVVEHLGAAFSPKPAPPSGTVRRGLRANQVEITLGGKLFILELKEPKPSVEQWLDAIEAALAQILDDRTQIFSLKMRDPELLPVASAVIEQVPQAVQLKRQALTEQNIEALVGVYMANDPLASALPDLERDNAEAQARFLARWPMLSAEQVADLAGHGSKNRSATTSRWKSAGRIFGVRTGGREMFPAFQFEDGAPRKAIGSVLAALPGRLSPWQTAFWFVGPNGWLDGKAPVERLNDEAALVAAARHEDEAWAG